MVHTDRRAEAVSTLPLMAHRIHSPGLAGVSFLDKLTQEGNLTPFRLHAGVAP